MKLMLSFCFPLFFISSVVWADFEPPYWLSGFQEFEPLRRDQKKIYIEGLKAQLPAIPGMPKISENKWDQIQEDAELWNGLKKEIYTVCANPQLKKKCQALADLRVKVINMYANQSEKNLKGPSL